MTASLPTGASLQEMPIERTGSPGSPPPARRFSRWPDVVFSGLALGAAWLTLALLAGIIGSLVAPVFDRIAATFVDAFVRRAEQLNL